MADAARRRVRVVGSYGTSFSQLATLSRADADHRRRSPSGRCSRIRWWSCPRGSRRQLPPEYAALLGITTLVCTPLSAAGRAYGVICADRGGGRFELSDGERHLLWTLGKTAALVATARNATRQQERTRRLGERLDLAREIHERVMQRLFGVSLALSAERRSTTHERERCRVEMQEALSDLRSALERPLAPVPPRPGRRSRPSSSGSRSAPGRRVRDRLAVERDRSAGPRTARPVGAGRGAAQHRQARRADRRSRSRVARRRHVHARGPQRRRRGPGRAAPEWGCGWRGSRRFSTAAWSSSGRRRRAAGACASSCPCRR